LKKKSSKRQKLIDHDKKLELVMDASIGKNYMYH
jgi:hypothetical protein